MATIITPDHPFYVKEQGFVEAKDLESGYEVKNVDDRSSFVEKVTLEVVETPETVYTFQVEEYHDYYVSNSMVLVHNAACGDNKGVGQAGNVQEETVQPAIGNASQAQSVLDGINPKYFNPESRFGGEFMWAQIVIQL